MKVRKPNDNIEFIQSRLQVCKNKLFVDAFDLEGNYQESLDSEKLKEFHKWLGQAIKYLEQKK